MAEQVLSISQINGYIQSRLDADPLLSQVAVRGEISNYKLYPSGHHYFTLKDENGNEVDRFKIVRFDNERYLNKMGFPPPERGEKGEESQCESINPRSRRPGTSDGSPGNDPGRRPAGRSAADPSRRR